MPVFAFSQIAGRLVNVSSAVTLRWIQVKEADMPKVEDGERWAAMQADWQAVNQEARTARLRVTQAFIRAAAGDGSGPTTAQLELAEKLELAADDKRLALDEFVKQAFG
jgi:uncharacterized membrane protein YebE (DUF533 family)